MPASSNDSVFAAHASKAESVKDSPAGFIAAPCNLRAMNTFGLNSNAEAFVRLTDAAQLHALSDCAGRYPKVFVLGAGSNVVLAERIGGLVIKPDVMGRKLIGKDADHHLVEAGAGENWHDFVQFTVDQGWPGLENLAFIPGTVGAAPVQNIGAYGVELSQRLHSVDAWHIRKRERVTLSVEQCLLAYRDSRFKRDAPGEWLILSVRFRLPCRWTPVLDYPDLQRHAGLAAQAAGFAPLEARDVFEAVCAIRRAKLPDPARIGNAGSFFKNPLVPASTFERLAGLFPDIAAYPQADGRYKLAAGWLIDRCGWKGRARSAAGVHERQALVLVNRGGATAGDIIELARAIERDVRSRFGVELEPEPVFVC